MLRLFFKFGLFGVATASIYYLVYLYLILLFFDPILATTIAFSISVVVSYFFNKFYVFNTREGSFIKFILIALNGLLLNISIVYVFTDLIVHDSEIAGLIVVVAVPMHNFIINYLFNFKNSQ